MLRRARRPAHGFFGSYPTYAEAAAAAGGQGYAEERLVEALVARQERETDVPASPELDPRWTELQLALGYAVDGRGDGELRVLDFGGGPGGHYFDTARHRRASGWPSAPLGWHVGETSEMVAVAAPRLANDELSFHSSLDALAGDPYDLLHVSGSLQYVPDAEATWDRLAAIAHRWLVLNRTPFVEGAADVFAVQRVLSPDGTSAAYPGRFLAREPWQARIGRTHDLVARWGVTSDRPYVQRVRGVSYEGMLLRRR
jgi:putative methyltransferase (TIGR04325 family)